MLCNHSRICVALASGADKICALISSGNVSHHDLYPVTFGLAATNSWRLCGFSAMSDAKQEMCVPAHQVVAVSTGTT
jgi:hypothetical protein